MLGSPHSVNTPSARHEILPYTVAPANDIIFLPEPALFGETCSATAFSIARFDSCYQPTHEPHAPRLPQSSIPVRQSYRRDSLAPPQPTDPAAKLTFYHYSSQPSLPTAVARRSVPLLLHLHPTTTRRSSQFGTASVCGRSRTRSQDCELPLHFSSTYLALTSPLLVLLTDLFLFFPSRDGKRECFTASTAPTLRRLNASH